MEALRYPIGRFDPAGPAGPDVRPGLIDDVAIAPARLRGVLDGLHAARLDTPYRQGGWTVRQVVHHVPDSHLNAYVRFKWTLTEDRPVIKTYDEALWAELSDSRDTPVDVSLALLDALHVRWVTLMRAMDDAQWQRTMQHPEWGDIALATVLALYAWHGKHHVAHIAALRDRMGW